MKLMSGPFPKRLILFGIVVPLAAICPPAISQQVGQNLPVVTSVGAPEYPFAAQNERIQGAVRVQAFVDQGKPALLQVQDGPPLLYQAALAYIRTWQFKPAPPTNFVVTLRYRIEDVKECAPQKQAVVLHLPTEVDIIAKDTKSCDLLATILARNQPRTIGLAIELNGEAIPPLPGVSLTFDGRTLNLPVQNGQFTVPIDVVRAKSVEFSFLLPEDQISTTLDGGDFASESWTLFLADRRFDANFQTGVPKGAKVRFSCFLEFDSKWTDPGTTIFDPHCRTHLKPAK
jgi:TonB family protein